MREGDEAALDELIGRKTKPLLQLTQRILGDLEEARDVVQVTFFKVWENRRKFDERWSPNTWIYRIASNLAIDHLRSRKSRERSHEPVRQHLLQVADGTRPARPRAPAAGRGGGDLPRARRPASPRSSAWSSCCARSRGSPRPRWREIVGCRESTVRNHLFNARKFLRRELLRRYPEYAGRLRRPARWKRERAVTLPDWTRAGRPPPRPRRRGAGGVGRGPGAPRRLPACRRAALAADPDRSSSGACRAASRARASERAEVEAVRQARGRHARAPAGSAPRSGRGPELGALGRGGGARRRSPLSMADERPVARPCAAAGSAPVSPPRRCPPRCGRLPLLDGVEGPDRAGRARLPARRRGPRRWS